MTEKTAAEVMADLERRQREEPAFREELERRESERAARARHLRLAEQPVVQDLRDLGIDVESAWDLDKVPDSRPKAIPVLLKHLALEYPDRVLFGIGAGLGHRSARAWWSDLRDMMLTTDSEMVQDRLAAALSVCAAREHFDDLLAFIQTERMGERRVYFLRTINRIGNRISAGQGRAVIQALADDPVLGKEARAILRGLSHSQ